MRQPRNCPPASLSRVRVRCLCATPVRAVPESKTPPSKHQPCPTHQPNSHVPVPLCVCATPTRAVPESNPPSKRQPYPTHQPNSPGRGHEVRNQSPNLQTRPKRLNRVAGPPPLPPLPPSPSAASAAPPDSPRRNPGCPGSSRSMRAHCLAVHPSRATPARRTPGTAPP